MRGRSSSFTVFCNEDDDTMKKYNEAEAMPNLNNADSSSFSPSGEYSFLERRDSFSNWRRKLLLKDHLDALREHLIQDLCRVYVQEKVNTAEELSCFYTYEEVVAQGEGTHNDEKQPEELIGEMVRTFVLSLPPRYVLSIDSPSEALVHMRCVKSVERNPLDAFIHIKQLDCGDNLTFCTDGSTNLKVVLVCCSHTIGLMECLMGTLVAGGNEIFDTNYLLSNDKVMLIRCVINLKGVTCFEKLQQQLSVFIKAARGMPFDPSMIDELPVSTKIGPFDPSTVSHITLSDTIMGLEDEVTIVERFDPPQPLLDLISSVQDYTEVGTIGTSKMSESDVSSLSAASTFETHQLSFDEGVFGGIIVDGTLSKKSNGCIYRGKLRNNSLEKYALKVSLQENLHPSKFDDIICEAKMGIELNHENICRYIDAIQTQSHICIAYEYCSKGPLSRIIYDKDVKYDYLPIARDICNGMAYLHSKNIIHRDLKPANILIDGSNRAKVADFGLSITHTGCEELTGETGTYRWMAPEVIRHEPYSIMSDIYSFALVCWNLLTREIPFEGLAPVQAAYAVACRGKRPQIPSHVPEYIARIITSCWDQEQLKRPSFAHVSIGLSKYSSVVACNDKTYGKNCIDTL